MVQREYAADKKKLKLDSDVCTLLFTFGTTSFLSHPNTYRHSILLLLFVLVIVHIAETTRGDEGQLYSEARATEGACTGSAGGAES